MDAYNRSQAKIIALEEDLREAKKICDVWKCKAMIAEQQKDEVLTKISNILKTINLVSCLGDCSAHKHAT